MQKKTIKVVKREDRRRNARTPRVKKSASEDPTRKTIKTVSGWVREFKEKGNSEANSVFAALFDKIPRPSEA